MLSRQTLGSIQLHTGATMPQVTSKAVPRGGLDTNLSVAVNLVQQQDSSKTQLHMQQQVFDRPTIQVSWMEYGGEKLQQQETEVADAQESSTTYFFEVSPGC